MLWGQSTRGAWDLLGMDAVAVALRTHWFSQSLWLSNIDSVLDVGSGPGVIARLLKAPPSPASAIEPSRWICLDQAHISSDSVEDLPGLQMIGGQRFEDAAPPEAGVGALISNFGLEYMEPGRWVPATACWLRNGARLHALVHASGSVIDLGTEQWMADLSLALDELDFFTLLARLLEAKATAPADVMARMMHGLEVRDEYNRAVNRMKARIEDRGVRGGPILDILLLARDMVQAVPGLLLEDAHARTRRSEKSFRAELSRLQAMRKAAWDEQAASSVVALMELRGFQDIRVSEMSSGSVRVAWVLEATTSSRS